MLSTWLLILLLLLLILLLTNTISIVIIIVYYYFCYCCSYYDYIHAWSWLTGRNTVEGGLVPWQRLPVLPEACHSSAVRGWACKGQEGLQHCLVHTPQPVH